MGIPTLGNICYMFTLCQACARCWEGEETRAFLQERKSRGAMGRWFSPQMMGTSGSASLQLAQLFRGPWDRPLLLTLSCTWLSSQTETADGQAEGGEGGYFAKNKYSPGI